MIMATVCLAAIKIGGIILGLTPLNTLLIASTITVIYGILGGFKGVVYTDFFQFMLAMSVTIWSAFYFIGLPEIQSLSNLLSHPNVINKLDLIPDINDREVFILFVLPIAVQWWSVWYPGAEPGGGGYIAQRMLSAKDENNAIWATLLFNFAHYAIRPWPWIIIALASLIIYPDLASISEALGLMKIFKERLSISSNDDFVAKRCHWFDGRLTCCCVYVNYIFSFKLGFFILSMIFTQDL